MEQEKTIHKYFDSCSELMATVTYCSVSHGAMEIRFDEGSSPFLGARLTLMESTVFRGQVPQFGPSRFSFKVGSRGVVLSSQCDQFLAQAKRFSFELPENVIG